MNFSEVKKILLRLFNQYIKKHFNKLLLSLFLSLVVAGSTGAIAWLLDPAIKKIFVEQDKSMMLLIPIAIALSFSIVVSYFVALTLLISCPKGTWPIHHFAVPSFPKKSLVCNAIYI